MRRAYRSINFRPATLRVIEQANEIARDYAGQGFSLTLRQLYYRFVAQDLIRNRQSEYKRLGSIINDARYAGLFDWNLITDRTRNATGGDHGMDDPADVIDPGVFSVTQWDDQPQRMEVWIEKDALIDVVQNAVAGLNVTSFSCRGYTSSSEIWGAARRVENLLVTPGVEKVTILHLGDHDPSGIDMTRDITDRMLEFIAGDGFPYRNVQIKRIALNMDQIEEYNPPPNPAKDTDSRFAGYADLYGEESWELDALEPRTLVNLIRTEVRSAIDPGPWNERRELTAKGQATLQAVRDNYDDVIAYLDGQGLLPEVKIEDDEEDE